MANFTPHAPISTPCGAKTRSGGSCRQPAMANGRCRMHGGKSLAGVASATFKDGRYSKYMPARLMARYHESEQDTELLNLKAEVSLVDARLADLLSRVDSGEAKTLWEKARKVNQEIQKAVHDENYGRLLMQCSELDYLIGSGLADHEAWYEIQALLDQRRKLVESERKRLVEMQQMVSAASAMTLATALLEAVRRNVTDRAVLTAVQSDFNRLVNLEQTKAEA
jgi:hypothetical protein